MNSVVSGITCQRFEKAALPNMRAESAGVLPRLHEFEQTHILDGFSKALSREPLSEREEQMLVWTLVLEGWNEYMTFCRKHVPERIIDGNRNLRPILALSAEGLSVVVDNLAADLYMRVQSLGSTLIHCHLHTTREHGLNDRHGFAVIEFQQSGRLYLVDSVLRKYFRIGSQGRDPIGSRLILGNEELVRQMLTRGNILLSPTSWNWYLSGFGSADPIQSMEELKVLVCKSTYPEDIRHHALPLSGSGRGFLYSVVERLGNLDDKEVFWEWMGKKERVIPFRELYTPLPIDQVGAAPAALNDFFPENEGMFSQEREHLRHSVSREAVISAGVIPSYGYGKNEEVLDQRFIGSHFGQVFGSLQITSSLKEHHEIIPFIRQWSYDNSNKKLLILNLDSHHDRYGEAARFVGRHNWALCVEDAGLAETLHFTSYYKENNRRPNSMNWRNPEIRKQLLSQIQNRDQQVSEIWITLDYDFFSLQQTIVPKADDESPYAGSTDPLPVFHLSAAQVALEIVEFITFLEENDIPASRLLPVYSMSFLNNYSADVQVYAQEIDQELRKQFGAFGIRQYEKQTQKRKKTEAAIFTNLYYGMRPGIQLNRHAAHPRKLVEALIQGSGMAKSFVDNRWHLASADIDKVQETNLCFITGTMESGKTTLINHLQTLGYSTYDEVGRVVIRRGIEAGFTVEEIFDDQHLIQNAIFGHCLEREMYASKEERIFCDRSSLDAIAFMRLAGVEEKLHMGFASRTKAAKVFILEPREFVADVERPFTSEQAYKLHDLLFEVYREAGYDPVLIKRATTEEQANAIIAYSSQDRRIQPQT